jgi:hypothetical protein
MTAVASLSFHNFLGMNTETNPNVLFVGEEYIMFPAGNSFVVNNTQTRQQRIFCPPEELLTGISAFVIAEGKPNVAFGDNSIQRTVCIFDIHTMHPRNFLHLGDDFGSTGFISLSAATGGICSTTEGTRDGRWLCGRVTKRSRL